MQQPSLCQRTFTLTVSLGSSQYSACGFPADASEDRLIVGKKFVYNALDTAFSSFWSQWLVERSDVIKTH